MKEKILKTFKALGFNLVPIVESEDCSQFEFEYEGATYLYLYSTNDPSFFNVALPGVLDLDEESEDVYYSILESVNSEMKYVKAYTVNRRLWIFYECETGEDTDFEDLVRRVVLRIEAAHVFMKRKYWEITHADCGDDDSDDDGALPMSEEGYDLNTLFGEVSPDECVLSDENEDDINDKED